MAGKKRSTLQLRCWILSLYSVGKDQHFKRGSYILGKQIHLLGYLTLLTVQGVEPTHILIQFFSAKVLKNGWAKLRNHKTQGFSRAYYNKVFASISFVQVHGPKCRHKHTLPFATIPLVSFLKYYRHFRIPSENKLLVIFWKIHPSQFVLVVKIQKDLCWELVERSIYNSRRFQRQLKLARVLMWYGYHESFH